MHVRSILDSKGRKTFTEQAGTPLHTAAKLMAKHRIGSLVIVDAGGSVVGILSERDIVHAVAEGGGASLDQPIASAMSSPVATCDEADTVDALMSEMTERRVRHLPVVDGKRLVGMISIGDVVKHRIEEIEREAESMREYIAMA